MRVLACLTLFLTIIAAAGCQRQTPQANAAANAPRDGERANKQSDSESRDGPASNVVMLAGEVDETPDPAFVSLIRIDFVGCEDLGGKVSGRLANFRFEYCWESTAQLETRLHVAAPNIGGSPVNEKREPPEPLTWIPFQSDSKGRAGLPLPTDPSSTNFLHVRLKEHGWNWFTFPAGRHPAALAGAEVFEIQPIRRSLRATLVRVK